MGEWLDAAALTDKTLGPAFVALIELMTAYYDTKIVSESGIHFCCHTFFLSMIIVLFCQT